MAAVGQAKNQNADHYGSLLVPHPGKIWDSVLSINSELTSPYSSLRDYFSFTLSHLPGFVRHSYDGLKRRR
jgi:hypothetical protein